MRALICRNWGDIDTLEMADIPPPTPGPGQILLDVVASSANFADSIMVAGNYQTKPAFPFAPGLEAAGFKGGFFDGRYIYYMPFTRADRSSTGRRLPPWAPLPASTWA